jgi:tRNA A37 threonylcarbamoyladenosine modification protein TsaB
MYLELNLTKNNAALYLKKGNKIIDKIEWEEANSLTQRLLVEADKIIRRNKLKKESLHFGVHSDLPVGYTSERIAQTVAKTYNFAVNERVVDK